MNPNKRPIIVAFALVFILSIFAGERKGSSQSAPLTSGIDYLKTAQNGDGSWAGTATSLNSVFPTTATALEALRAVEPTTSTNQTNAIAFLSTQNVLETAFLAAR